MVEQQIQRTTRFARRSAAIGLVLGIGLSLSLGLAFQRGWLSAAYAGVAVWFAVYALGAQVLARKTGRGRPLLSWLIGLVVFGAVSFVTSGILALVAPPALALLATYVFDGAVYLVNPAARHTDRIVRLLASPEAQRSPRTLLPQIEAAQLKRLQSLRRRYERDLAVAERTPQAGPAIQQYTRLIRELTAVSQLPPELQPLLGRAYLGLARHQLAQNDPQAGDTLKRAQNYPLPAIAIEIIAPYHAAKQDTSPAAIQCYTAYLRAHRPLKMNPQDPVAAAARRACTLSCSDRPQRLKEVEVWARAFFEADDRQGWAALCLGQSLLWQGQPQPALAYLEAATQRIPESAEPLLYLGQAHLAMKNGPAAIDLLRRALALNPQNPESQLALGQALITDGRAEQLPPAARQATSAEARRLLEAVVAAQPRRAEAYFALGLTDLADENYAAARSRLTQALALEASAAEWHYQLARACVGLDDFPQAMAAAQQALSRAPKHVPTLVLVGREQLRHQQWAEAEKTYRSLGGLEPGSPEAGVGLGRALVELGRYAEAVSILQSLAAPTRDALYYLGRAWALTGNFPASVAAYQNALTQFGPEPELCYALGCALANVGQLDVARAALIQSLALKESGKAHVQLGQVLLALQKPAEALKEYRQALRVASELPGAHYALGLYHYRAKHFDQARRGFALALRFAPDHAPAHFGLGVIAEAEGNLAQAQSHYQSALAAGGDRLPLLLRAGVVANKLGQSEAAVAALTEAQPAAPLSDELLYHLGGALAALGRWAEALTAWTALQTRQPDDETLRRNLAQCQYQLGQQYFAAGNYAAAAEAWEKCTVALPGDALLAQALTEAHFRRGLAELSAAGRGEPLSPQARAALKRARESSPDENWRLTYFEALASLAEGDLPPAMEALQHLYPTETAKGRIAYHLGFALRQAGQIEQAAPYLEEALQTRLPAHLRLGAQLILAELQLAAKRWPEAAQRYRAALEI